MWYENLKPTLGLGIISFVLVMPNRALLTSTYFCWWNINCRKGIASTSWISTIGIEKFSGGLNNNKTSYTVTSTKLILFLQYGNVWSTKDTYVMSKIGYDGRKWLELSLFSRSWSHLDFWSTIITPAYFLSAKFLS